MTIASEVNRSGPYNGNGVTTTFAYQFKIYDPEHLQVIKTDPNGTETTLVYQTDYSVAGVGDDGGGSAVLLAAPVAGYKVTLLLNVPFIQETDLENQGAYYAETVERAFDLVVMRLQQLKERSERTVTIPASADAAALDELLSYVVTLGDNVAALQVVASVSQYLEDVAAVAEDIPTVEGNTATAITKAGEAAASATAADGSATLAGQYANYAEDSQIPGHAGEYSGLHFRNKCQTIFNNLVNTVAGWIHGAAAKALPTDADEIGLVDSAAAWVLKKLTLISLRAYIVAGVTGDRDALINGSGSVSQRTYTTVADDVYWCDRHYILTQTAAITPTIISDAADGYPTMMRLTQSQAAAQRIANAQIVEALSAKRYRGKQVTLGGVLRCSSSQPIRYAILEWAGTADAVTSDVVNNWTNATFTAGQFFIAGVTVTAVGSITPAANVLTPFSLLANISSTCNNLIVVMWTEGTAAQNVTLDMVWGFVQGDATKETWPYVTRQPPQELALCQRYYEKVTVFAVSYNASGTAVQAAMGTFKVTKRTPPSVGAITIRSGVLTTPGSTDVTGDAVWVTFSSTGASQQGSFIVPVDSEL